MNTKHKPGTLAELANELERAHRWSGYRACVPAAAILRQLSEHGVHWCETCEQLYAPPCEAASHFWTECDCEDQP